MNVVSKIQHQLFLVSKKLLHNSEVESFLFVAGMQRSGTNMLMELLECSFVTDVYHEWDERAFDNYQMRDREVIDALVKRSGARIFTIKALCELQDLPDLRAYYTPAKVLWIFRSYGDVVNSMMNSFNNMDKQIIRISDDPESEAWLGKGMSTETHDILKKHVSPDINLANASALQWYLRNILFFEHGFDKDEKVLALSYDKLVRDPEIEIARVFQFSGLHFTNRIARKIYAASIGKRPSPVLDEGVKALCENLQQRIRLLENINA